LPGGNWDDKASWSLGVLPGAGQNIYITNAAERVVVIDSETAQSAPTSLTMQTLTLGASNALVMDNLGTNTPVTVTGVLVLNEGAGLTNSASALDCGGLAASGPVLQDGGIMNVGGVTLVDYGAYILSNGVFNCGDLELIDGGNWTFTQEGGISSITSIQLVDGANFNLNGGEMSVGSIGFQEGGAVAQNGGANHVSGLDVYSVAGASYTLNNGLFYRGSLSISAGIADGAQFLQSGGTNIVTNSLYLAGEAYHYPWDGVSANYSLSGGALIAQSLTLDTSGGPSDFWVGNGSAFFAGTIDVSNVTWAPGAVSIGSGALGCENFLNSGGTIFMSQTGGVLLVTNLFQFGGYYPRPYGFGAGHGVYTLSGGTAFASNIIIDSEWNIGGSAGAITNPGSFQLSGVLDIGSSQQLGIFILATNGSSLFAEDGTPTGVPAVTHALINFTGNDVQLAFASSSGMAWTNGVKLVITNWEGSLNGGGAEQLKFGGSSSGLAPAQLAQIQFVNPGGLPAGTYSAQILDSGEVVPLNTQWVVMTEQNKSLCLTWPAGTILQSSTNAAGPYTDVPGAVSPYTPAMTNEPRQFFRFRQ